MFYKMNNFSYNIRLDELHLNIISSMNWYIGNTLFYGVLVTRYILTIIITINHA